MRVIEAFDEPVRAVAVSPEGRFLAAASADALQLFDWITGARLEIMPAHPLYENVRPNAVLVQAVRANAEAIGMPIDDTPPGWNGGGASTDFGNVSQALPAYYLRFAVSQEPVPGHSTQMAEAARSPLALARRANSSARDLASSLDWSRR